MKFSLIVPTLNRVKEPERLFQSLVAQNYDDFEVIIVDQNTDNRLGQLVDTYRQHFPIIHIKEPKRGQSHARNVGFYYVKGDIVAFPDDDCLYTEGVLANVAQFFDRNRKLDGIIGHIYDLDEDKNAFEFCGDTDSQTVDYVKGYQVGVSCAMFFRAAVTKAIAFDETLGPGAGTRWACGDDTDYLFRCLDADYRFYYDASLIVRHPNPSKKNDFRQHIRREYGYGLGKGYFLATHTLPPPFLKYEYSVPYQHALSEITTGNWRRAIYFLANGIGTTLGYRSGLKRHYSI